jgi:predicted PurR-regulated permease PerM
MRKRTAAAASGNLLPAIGLLVGIGALYFARQILIPFALAILCAFLLNPAVKRLQFLRIPRVAAVLLTMIVAFGALAGIGWVVTEQLVEIINDLPQYRNNIDEKMASLRAPSGASRLVATLQDLGKELTTTPPSKVSPVTPRKPARSAHSQSALDAATDGTPVKVEVIEPPPNALQSVRNFLGPLLGPLETMGIVLVFALFMLIDQEDLRNRLLRLLGSNQLHRTTKALDDAAQRVSRYLMMQFLVNASLGAVIALGLYFIGVRSFLLWGVLTVFLRFVPYVGILVAGALPFLLAVDRAVLRLRTHHRQLYRTDAVRGAYGTVLGCDPCRHRFLDRSVGSGWAHSVDTAHGVSERSGAVLASPRVSERVAGR